DQFAVVGDEGGHAQLVHDQLALPWPAAGGHHLGLAAQAQPLGLWPIGAEHVAAAHDPDPDRIHGPTSRGSNSKGKNRPPIGCPFGIGGTPSSIVSSDADRVPSRKTLITTARRGPSLAFASEPCTIKGWWKAQQPFGSGMGIARNRRRCSGVSTARIASLSPARPVIGSRGQRWLPGT